MAERYAAALGITPQWLLYGEQKGSQAQVDIARFKYVRLPILHKAAAGFWLPADEIADQPIGFYPEALVLPEYAEVQQWIEVVEGDSMNRLLPDGALIHVVDAIGLGYAPRHDDIVVVVRRRAQGAFVERSVKQVALTPTGVELWPRSFNEKWSTPLPFLDGVRENEDVEIEIVGKVVKAYIDFPK